MTHVMLSFLSTYPFIHSIFEVETCRVNIGTYTNQDVPMASQEPPVVVDLPPPRYPPHVCMSIRSQDFVYSIYSTSFASFLTAIHNLSGPSF